jgi:hypothetical protein
MRLAEPTLKWSLLGHPTAPRKRPVILPAWAAASITIATCRWSLADALPPPRSVANIGNGTFRLVDSKSNRRSC